MDKMRMASPDMTAQNIEKIAALFPNCITEMLDEEKSTSDKKIYKKAVNFELLKQTLSGEVLDGDEAYEFTWVGKKAAIVEANRPIRKTLRPCPEESVDWDKTENLYIEGDNLEVLKLLQESYLGKVKVIYIDPPYNTGNSFIYLNDFAVSQIEHEIEAGMVDEAGNRLIKNTETNGRFHSDWCSMMYARLLLSRNLLSEDGIIVLTIDDYEIHDITIIMNEVFGESNRLATIAIKNNPSGRSTTSGAAIAHEYAIVYRKGASTSLGRLPRNEDQIARYKEHDNIGLYEWVNFRGRYTTSSPKMAYPIFIKKDGSDFRVPSLEWDETRKKYNITESIREDEFISLPVDEKGNMRSWKWSISTLKQNKNTEVAVRINSKKMPAIYVKARMNTEGMLPLTIWDDTKYSSTEYGTNYLTKLMGKKYFAYPKSIYAVIDSLRIAHADRESIILDFFSGSSTTAHAVMKLNAEDGGHRKFIMVQLPEQCDEQSEAYKAGYKNICEIGKERIRRAGKKIKSESPLTTQDLDVGFRVLKLADSNMNDVYYSPTEYNQQMLMQLESNIKADRNDLDLLFGCLLDWGLPLSLPYSSEEIDGCMVHDYNDGDLIACFDENIPDSVVKAIARKKPLRAVFRDSCFNGSPAKINVEEIFKLLAPDTRVKVI